MRLFEVVPHGKKGVFLVVATQLIVAAAIGFGISHQVRATNKAINQLSELADPSPYRAALIGHLGKITLALQGFLRSADATLAPQIEKASKEFDASLIEFKAQNSRLFPQTALEEISHSFSRFKQAVTHTLAANTQRQAVRSRLEANFAFIFTSIADRIRPLIRDPQADSEERREAALNLENQARAWQQNLMKAWAEPGGAVSNVAYENDSRGTFYIDQYSRLQLLPRERKVLKEVKDRWKENSDISRKSLVHEKLVQESETFVSAQRELVISSLNKYLPAMSPQDLEKRKRKHIFATRLSGTLTVLLGVIGLVSVGLFVGALGAAIRGPRKLGSGKSAKEPDFMVKMNLKGNITGWSPEAQKLYKYSSDEVVGEPISMLFESGDDIQRLSKELTKAEIPSFESMHKTKNGTLFKVVIDFEPITDSSGKVIAISLTCTPK